MSDVLSIPLQPAIRLTLGERVADSLREAIFGGHFKPDQRLSEAQVASRLRVSRAPVRDALAQLELEGLVVRANNRGIAVRVLAHTDVDEICSLRCALEGLALKRALRQPEDYADQLAEVIQETKGVETPDALALVDLKFHETLVRAARHERLLTAWLNLRSQIRLLLVQRNVADAGTRQGTVRSHAELLRVIRSGDEARALALLDRHLGDHYTWFLAGGN